MYLAHFIHKIHLKAKLQNRNRREQRLNSLEQDRSKIVKHNSNNISYHNHNHFHHHRNSNIIINSSLELKIEQWRT